jgi:Ca-activated chloride channel homolog
MPALLVAFLLFATAAPLEPWTAAPTGVVPGTTSAGVRTAVLTGTVTSETGASIQGANVYINDLGIATLTSAEGTYTITIPAARVQGQLVTLRVRAVGYAPQVRPVRVTDGSQTFNFQLKQDVNRLEEIVVTSAVDGVERAKVPFAVARLQMRGAGAGYAPTANARGIDPSRWNTEEYARIEDNRFVSVASSPLSTFSVDVDRASYTNVRRFINTGSLPPKDAVRIEELINYFSYDYEAPGGQHPVSITTEVARAPWNQTHLIARIGLQTQRIRTEKLPPSNLVFLIDVSGSMMPANKLPLVKQAFRLLVNELREQDRVAMVVYAGSAGLVLPSTSAADKQVILDAIERLEAGGSTAGGEGIRLAYNVAKENYRADGNNRVILATDGDFNVGVSNTADLVRFVEERRGDGIALSVLGFGMGNIKDNRLEQLADKGNGNYAYIDDLLEARKVFVHEMGATLVTVAKDVKLQVEFNPAAVQAYRLIGYENRLLRNEDFTDDKKDAGDMGAGHSVTALYEIVPVGAKLDVAVGGTDTLRYQTPRGIKLPGSEAFTSSSDELLFVNVRYKPPTDSVSRLLQHPVRNQATPATRDFAFVLSVAGYGMLLRDSEFKGTIRYDEVLRLARAGAGDDRYRLDFITLVEKTRTVAAGVAKGQ